MQMVAMATIEDDHHLVLFPFSIAYIAHVVLTNPLPPFLVVLIDQSFKIFTECVSSHFQYKDGY